MDAAAKDQDFKWFGEGFDGFPKRLPEDCIEYIICVIDEKINSEAALRSRLKEIQTAANKLTKELLKDYIWQRDSFKLDLVAAKDVLKASTSSKKEHLLPLSHTLQGQTNFGDSIADEWLIVYLLRELSKQFPDAWIKVADTDGEFLLIEAANALPKWLNPEVAENRVWINHGQLKLISQEQSSSGSLSFGQALDLIQKSAKSLLHIEEIEKEAFFRLRDYPSAISSSLHNALIKIPRRLAYVLHQNPSYISSAIESFYVRDPISLKPLATKDTATLHFAPEDFVTVSVRFTRVGYAQLRSQEFAPPPAWTAIRPHAQEPQVAMGLKVSCGFEMLLQDKQNQDRRTVREIKLLLEDIDSGEDFLTSNEDISKWPRTQDDEKWLDINFEDLETELSGKSAQAKTKGFGDEAAQDNLRKMVSRFESFVKDDDAGVDGVEDLDDMDSDDESTGSSEPSSTGEDKNGSFDDKEFEQAMREMMGMPPDQVEKSGLLDEARKLALDMEDEEEGERDEEEEVKKIMEMMDQELRGHGALNLNPSKRTSGKAVAKEDLGELSSDDELEDNDIDEDLVKNMLEALKGQGGMSGPAGNMMRAMGIQLPRDEGREDDGT